jgi:hypothetical protein
MNNNYKGENEKKMTTFILDEIGFLLPRNSLGFVVCVLLHFIQKRDNTLTS